MISRIASFVVALALCIVSAQAQFFAAGSGSHNLYALNDYGQGSYNTTAGRTTATAPAAGASTGVFIVVGQSQAGNHGVSNYGPTNAANCLQINIHDGIVYRLTDPALGATGSAGSYIGRLCDKLIAAGKYTNVVMIPAAIGGTKIKQWTPAGDPALYGAGWWAHRLVAALKRAHQQGYAPQGIIWEQGTQDAAAGTSQAAWQADFQILVSMMSSAGFTGKWLVPQSTLVSGVGSNATIRAAQAAVANGSTIIAGPDLDTLTGGNLQADGVHRTDTGNDNAATALSSSIVSNF
jgi:hypothetical protein